MEKPLRNCSSGLRTACNVVIAMIFNYRTNSQTVGRGRYEEGIHAGEQHVSLVGVLERAAAGVAADKPQSGPRSETMQGGVGETQKGANVRARRDLTGRSTATHRRRDESMVV